MQGLSLTNPVPSLHSGKRSASDPLGHAFLFRQIFGAMRITSLLWVGLLAGGLLLPSWGGGARAQAQGGGYDQPQDEQSTPRSSERQSQDRSIVHGITVAGGLSIYQGDFSLNPEHNLVKYIAGNGDLLLRVGADHRLGEFNQYGLGADLVYSRLAGSSSRGTGFKANSVSLDLYADYELPYIYEGLFRVFVGGGPNLLIAPSYTGRPFVQDPEDYQRLGTRVIGSLKVGVTILDTFRIGTRISSSDLLDGYKGFASGSGIPDFVSFLNIGYRFRLN